MKKIIMVFTAILAQKLKIKINVNFDGAGGLTYGAEKIGQEGVDKLLKI